MNTEYHREQARTCQDGIRLVNTSGPDADRIKALLKRLADTHEAVAATIEKSRGHGEAGTICAGTCGRKVRPKDANPEDYPGALVAMAWGMCNYCYARKPRVLKRDNAEECKGCERPFRPRDGLVADYPGTVAKYVGGKCKSCHNKAEGVTKRQLSRRPERCQHCERLLRPKLRSIHEFPGTVEHAGKGLCTTCKTDVVRGKVPHPRPLEQAVATPSPRKEFREIQDPGLLRMRQMREARKAQAEKQERIRQVRIQQEQARARFIASRRQVA